MGVRNFTCSSFIAGAVDFHAPLQESVASFAWRTACALPDGATSLHNMTFVRRICYIRLLLGGPHERCRPFCDFRFFTAQIRSRLGTIKKKGAQPSLEARRAGFRELRIALQVCSPFYPLPASRPPYTQMACLTPRLQMFCRTEIAEQMLPRSPLVLSP